MNAAVKLLLEECEDTEGTVETLADQLEHYGFEAIHKKSTKLVDLINRKNRGGYSRV